MPSVRSIHTLPAAALGLALASGSACAADTARWVMSFPSPTNNAVEFERRYGGVTFLNREAGGCGSCASGLFSAWDSLGNFARWSFSNPGSERIDYKDVGGILLPLDPVWSWNHDLRGSKGIRIKVRSSTRCEFRLGIEGPAAPYASVGVQPEAVFAAEPSWKWIRLDWSSFVENLENAFRLEGKEVLLSLADSLGRTQVVYTTFRKRPVWASNDAAEGERYTSDSGNVLKNVRAFKIIPLISTLVPRANLDIDSIVIEGIPRQWGRIRGSEECRGEALVVDRFDGNRSIGMRNLLGGSWETAMAPGSSLAPLPFGAWDPTRGATMEARLEGAPPGLLSATGWARLTTWLDPGKTARNVPSLVGISFQLQAGGSWSGFDSTKIHGVTFRLHSSEVDDSVGFSVRIPYDRIRPIPGDSGRAICIQADELRQPGWHTGKAGIRTIDPSTLTALSWTLSLDEPTASGSQPSSILVRDPKLWSTGTSAIQRTTQRILQARAIEGHLVVSAERGRNLHVQIRDLSGRVVMDRSLWATGSEQRVGLPVRSDLLVASVTDGTTRTHLRILPR